MTGEKYLVCHECKKYVYVCKNGRLGFNCSDIHKHDLACFINKHSYECDSGLCVYDESLIPPDISSGNPNNLYERYYYEQYTCTECFKNNGD